MAGRRLEGKVAVVTGAGSTTAGIGTGRASSVVFARESARVVLVDRNADAARATKAMIDAEGGESFVLEADVTETTAAEEIVARTTERYGRLDVLVNNVAIVGPLATATEIAIEDWEQVLRVNVTSVLQMVRHAVPAMAEGGGGSIVNVASLLGSFGGVRLIAYSASKGAVVNMTRALAADHGPQGIRVNCIAPGYIYAPMVEGMSDEQREKRRQRGAIKEEGTGWDVAFAALFLASDEARWITGVILPVDGGVTAFMEPPL